DPYYYNAPEGSYANNPADESRILELKELIKKFHDNNIGVIMDVVYNHTYYTEKSAFQILAPGYFHRNYMNEFANGSGCGNEIATERPMVRKFIIKSLCYWTEEYHIDGFRFDLMGLMDKRTMTQIEKTLHKIDPSILIYGEPWYALPPQLEAAQRIHKGFQKGKQIAVFNDNFREAIKGDSNGKGTGYVTGDIGKVDMIKKGVTGEIHFNQNLSGFTLKPSETINYVSCHDDLTLWDKLNKLESRI
ncbi:MAG: alpha-amylase family glycosyl hydrolase, partial [Minisyncoccales bacterium]